MGKVIVGNPGAIPELAWMAAGLARAELLEFYAAPFVYTRGEIARLRRLGRLSQPICRELDRRRAAEGLPRRLIRRRGAGLEALSVAWHRTRGAGEALTRIWAARNRAFDRTLTQLLHRGVGAVVGVPGASLATFSRAHSLGIARVLESPIAHHAFAERVLAEEARRNPEWAASLHYHGLAQPFRKHYEREIGAASLILTLSTVHRRSFVEAGVPEQKLAVTPLGVDTSLFSPRDTPRDDGVFRVLFVGQLTQRKGLSYLLHAFEAADIPHAELVVAGGGALPPPLRTARDVRILRHKPRTELPKLYRDADCFVLPSLVEGFAMTALEAMACGLPVIISDHTFGTDVVEDGVSGFVVPIRDPDAITERLRALAWDADRRAAMGCAARQAALRHSWDAYGDRVARLLASHAGREP